MLVTVHPVALYTQRYRQLAVRYNCLLLEHNHNYMFRLYTAMHNERERERERGEGEGERGRGGGLPTACVIWLNL